MKPILIVIGRSALIRAVLIGALLSHSLVAQAARFAIQVGPISALEFEGIARARGYTTVLDQITAERDGTALDVSSGGHELSDVFDDRLEKLRVEQVKDISRNQWTDRVLNDVRQFVDLRLAADWSALEQTELCKWITLLDEAEALRFRLGNRKCDQSKSLQKAIVSSSAQSFASSAAIPSALASEQSSLESPVIKPKTTRSSAAIELPGEHIRINGQSLSAALDWFQIGKRSTLAERKREVRSGSYRISLYSNRHKPIADVFQITSEQPDTIKAEIVRHLEKLRRSAIPWIDAPCDTQKAVELLKAQLEDPQSILYWMWRTSVAHSESFAVALIGPNRCLIESTGPNQATVSSPLQQDLDRRVQQSTGSRRNGIDPLAVPTSHVGPTAFDATLSEGSPESDRPLYKRPWFWVVVGSIVIASGAAIARASQNRSQNTAADSSQSGVNQPTITRVGWGTKSVTSTGAASSSPTN